MIPNITQLEMVRNELLEKKEMTAWDAIRKFHITRLSQYISVLRNEGYEIESKRESDNKNWWVRYILKGTPKGELI